MRKGQTIAVKEVSRITNLKGCEIADGINVEDLSLDDLKMDFCGIVYATGMTAKQFGDVVGIPKRTVEQWRSGEKSVPPYTSKLILYYLINEEYIKDYKIDEQTREKVKGKTLDVIEGKITNLKGYEIADDVNIEEVRLSDLKMDLKDIFDKTALNTRQFAEVIGMPLRTLEDRLHIPKKNSLYINSLILYYLINEEYIKGLNIKYDKE